MSTVSEFQAQRKTCEELVELRDMALRLSENRDFRKLFIEGFFRDEAARMVQLSEDPILTREQQHDALRMAQATGHAKRYLSMLVVRGNSAAKDIIDLDEQLEELRREEAADEADRLGSSVETGNDGAL